MSENIKMLTNSIIYENLINSVLSFESNLLIQQKNELTLDLSDKYILGSYRAICSQYRDMQALKTKSLISYNNMLPRFINNLKKINGLNIVNLMTLNKIIQEMINQFKDKKTKIFLSDLHIEILENFDDNLKNFFQEMQKELEIYLQDLNKQDVDKKQVSKNELQKQKVRATKDKSIAHIFKNAKDTAKKQKVIKKQLTFPNKEEI